MKVVLLVVGKTTEKYIQEAVEVYRKRLEFYIPFSIEVIPELKNAKNMPIDVQREKDSEAILKALLQGDEVILLDERGKEFSSIEFSKFIEKKMAASPKRLIFVVGGPFGFSKDIYARANEKVSISKMTFSHQMIRILFVEQLYRAMTIIRGESYHHE